VRVCVSEMGVMGRDKAFVQDITAPSEEIRESGLSGGTEDWMYAIKETSPAAHPIDIGMNRHAN
jgi:hypothetical protein